MSFDGHCENWCVWGQTLAAHTFRIANTVRCEQIRVFFTHWSLVSGSDQSCKFCIHPRNESAAPPAEIRQSRPNNSDKSSQRLGQVVPTTQASRPNDSGKLSQRLRQVVPTTLPALSGDLCSPFRGSNASGDRPLMPDPVRPMAHFGRVARKRDETEGISEDNRQYPPSGGILFKYDFRQTAFLRQRSDSQRAMARPIGD